MIMYMIEIILTFYILNYRYVDSDKSNHSKPVVSPSERPVFYCPFNLFAQVVDAGMGQLAFYNTKLQSFVEMTEKE